MNYEELVKALRHCVSDEKGVTKCAGCPYYPDITGCIDRLHTDAAAAIEALQAELEKKRSADCWGCKCEKVEPKRGKWKVDMSHFSPHIVCSVCGVEIPCVAGWCMDAHMNYCPNCGAKMEVQE